MYFKRNKDTILPPGSSQPQAMVALGFWSNTSWRITRSLAGGRRYRVPVNEDTMDHHICVKIQLSMISSSMFILEANGTTELLPSEDK